MDREVLIKILAEFFMESLREDPAGVGDWLAQGDQDADSVILAVEALQSSK